MNEPIPAKIRILYVDNEQYNLNAFKAYFRVIPEYEIFICQSGREGLEILNQNIIHVVIADQQMPYMTGIEFLAEISKNNFEPVKIVVTAHRDTSAIEKAFDEGKIFKYYDKPYDLEELKGSIEDGYKVYRTRIEKTPFTKFLNHTRI